jgi:hypothetical protein
MSPFPRDSCNVDECLSTRSSRTAPLGAGFDVVFGERQLKMKTKLFVSLLLLTAAVAPGALAAADGGDRNFHTGRGQLVTPVDDPAVKNAPTSPAVVPNDPKQVLQDYDSLMIALTQKFSATLATIAEAVKRGEVSSEQAREMSAEQYQVTHMQFELLSLWRGIEEQDSARIPDVGSKTGFNARRRSRNGGVAVLIPSTQSLFG